MTMVNTAEAGVPLDGRTDSTPALQGLLDQGVSIFLSPGTYLLRHELRFRDSFQEIVGPGWGDPVIAKPNRDAARFRIFPSDHRLGYQGDPTGVVQIEHPHCSIRELKWQFLQPSVSGTARRQDAVKFAPAIALRSIGARLEDLWIEGAWDGIIGSLPQERSAQAGRAHMQRVYVGALNRGVDIPSAMGAVQGEQLQFWPWGWQSSEWLHLWAGSVACRFGAIDGLKLSQINAFRTRVEFVAVPYPKNLDVTRGPIGSFSDLMLDGSDAALYMEGTRMNGTNVYSTTKSDDPDTPIDVCGDAELILGGTNILDFRTRGPFVRTRDNARVILNGLIASTAGNRTDYVVASAEDDSHLTLIGGDIETARNDPTGTIIRQRGNALVTATGVRVRGIRSNRNDAQFADLERPELPHDFTACTAPGFVMPERVAA